MKLGSIGSAAGFQPVVLDGEDVIILPAADSPATFAALGPDGIRQLVNPGCRRLPLSEVHLGPPLGFSPRAIFAVGWNYLSHFDEGAGKRPEQDLPEVPCFFSKNPGTVVGPYDDIESHAALTRMLDWELELAVVIGRGGRDIGEQDALAHVFGYSVANDVSARDIQRRPGRQWFKGKSLDRTCPIGPWVVTADEIPDPQKLTMRCSVNGTEVQTGTTADMAFGVARLIAELSVGMSLASGDILLTGTLSGVGAHRDPPQFLAAGDVLESEISEIGCLRNTVT